MRINYFIVLGAIFATVVQPASAEQASSPPDTETFMNVMTSCGAGSSLVREGNFQATAKNIYEAERTQGKSLTDIIAKIVGQVPESQRLEAYKIYVDCVKSALTPRTQNTAPTAPAEPELSVTVLIDENSFCKLADMTGTKCQKPIGTAFGLSIENKGTAASKDMTINMALHGVKQVEKPVLREAMRMDEFAPLNTFGAVSPASNVEATFSSDVLSYQFKIPVLSPRQRAFYRIWRAGNELSFFDVSMSSEQVSFSKRVICDYYNRLSGECEPKIINIFPAQPDNTNR